MPLPQFANSPSSRPSSYEPVYKKPELLPNFAKFLKELNIMQVRQLENNVDRAIVSFMVEDNLPVGAWALEQRPDTQTQVRTENIILEETEIIDDITVLNDFNELIQNMDIDSVDLEIDTSMGDVDIKGLIMSSIYKNITESRVINPYIMTNYRLMCFLNNNIEKKFRKFYKKETSFEFIVNDDMGDEIIIGGNDNVNGPIFYLFNKGLTKSKLYPLPNASGKFKKLVIKRIDKEEQMDDTINEIMEESNDIPDFDDNMHKIPKKVGNKIVSESEFQEFLELVETDAPMVEPNAYGKLQSGCTTDDSPEIPVQTTLPYTLVEGYLETRISIDEINPGFNLFEITDSVFRRIMTIVCSKSPHKIVTNGKLGAFIATNNSFMMTPTNITITDTIYPFGSCMGFDFNIDASMIWGDTRFLLLDNEDNRIHTIVVEDNGDDLI